MKGYATIAVAAAAIAISQAAHAETDCERAVRLAAKFDARADEAHYGGYDALFLHYYDKAMRFHREVATLCPDGPARRKSAEVVAVDEADARRRAEVKARDESEMRAASERREAERRAREARMKAESEAELERGRPRQISDPEATRLIDRFGDLCGREAMKLRHVLDGLDTPRKLEDRKRALERCGNSGGP